MTQMRQAKGGDLKVLVAEDDELNRLLIARILESHEVFHRLVPDGLQAVQAFEKEDFDVVFLDLGMPVMDGMTAADRIRKLARLKNQSPLIVALSGRTPGEDLVGGRLFDYALEKPFSKAQLLEILRRNASAREPEPGEALFTEENLERIWEKIDEHPDFYAELLVQFEISARDHLAAIAALIRERSLKEALKVAHVLKGEFAIFSSSKARDTIEYLESLILKESLETALGVLKDLGGVLDDMVAVIEEYIKSKVQ